MVLDYSSLFISKGPGKIITDNHVFASTFQVAKRRQKLLNYMLFLRVTPTLPNTFINFASPIVDVPYHIFFFATLVGLIPAAYVTVRVLSYLQYLLIVLSSTQFNPIKQQLCKVILIELQFLQFANKPQYNT